ncbi:hypothetical protein SAMN05216582_1109 [Selenomonas ruminantium]|uniref:WD40-like Beta Propeller Repeat n=1 Tax=Selenomonas ruminantium TaxID=971 RepID=A0A1M6U065_SELRU|nr:hypothetical protein [Selenomonas ruminantium]SHK62478.1 hypothetical protein SAMN05216582_1109 [Selenomonas ruminantium]
MQEIKRLGRLALKLVAIVLLVLFIKEIVLYHTYLDLSQSYRQVDNYEGIVFKNNYTKTAYKRCFWGIKKTADAIADFDRHGDGGYNGETYKKLTAVIDDTGHLGTWASSPDGTKIVYSEGHVIDELEPTYIRYVDFKVLDLQSNSITVIFTAPAKEASLGLEWQ